MNQNDKSITHVDLINLGIFILDGDQEKTFLESINDRFAYLVGQEVIHRMTRSEKQAINTSEEINLYIEGSKEMFDEIINLVRLQMLSEVKEKRKLLTSGTTQ